MNEIKTEKERVQGAIDRAKEGMKYFYRDTPNFHAAMLWLDRELSWAGFR